MPAQRSLSRAAWFLIAIKAIHTLVWAFFVACVLAIWVFAWRADLFNAALSIGLVLIEVVVLAVNHWRCPHSPVAARFTDDRCANFDIYLPQWLAGHTMPIFGALYVAGIAFTLVRAGLAARQSIAAI